MKHFGSDATNDGSAPPLVVDVDGSLVSGDLLIEGVARMLADSPLKVFALPFWLAGGRAAGKRRVARAAPLPPETLALNRAVLEEIADAKAAGREVWLASAADEIVVAPLADAVDATGFLASDGRINLAGRVKAAALVERFGESGFDYVGNERRDLAVWGRARRAIGVGLSARLAREVRALDGEARLLPRSGGTPRDYFRALRPHQWIKNVLVFVPLVAVHEITGAAYLAAAVVFAALCAVASGTYLLNDLLDLAHDRLNESKRHRPMAAGRVRLLPMIGLGAALADCQHEQGEPRRPCAGLSAGAGRDGVDDGRPGLGGLRTRRVHAEAALGDALRRVAVLPRRRLSEPEPAGRGHSSVGLG